MIEGLLVSIVIVLNKIQIHKMMLRPEVLRGVVSVVHHGAADVDRLGSVPGLGGESWRVAKFRKLLQSIA